MPLRKEFEKTGGWLFRWRVYLPLALLVLFLPAFRHFSYLGASRRQHHVWALGCLSVTLAGLAVRIVTAGHAPARTSGRNTRRQVADSLNTTGLYSIMRNPLYFGNYFMMLGILLYPRAWWLPVIGSLAFWLYYERIIMAEEAFLLETYGAAYEAYSDRTPAFLPNPRLWKPAALPFSVKTVLKREHTGFFAALASFSALLLAGQWRVEGSAENDFLWAGLLLFGLLVYLPLRTLKKKTRVLHVEGR